jgi:hypothetical protein
VAAGGVAGLRDVIGHGPLAAPTEYVGSECVEGGPVGPVAAEAPVDAHLHQPSGPEDGEVLRHRRRRHLERGGDLAGGELAVADEPENLPPDRRRERLDELLDVVGDGDEHTS